MLLFLRVDLETVHIESIAVTVIFIDTIHDSISSSLELTRPEYFHKAIDEVEHALERSFGHWLLDTKRQGFDDCLDLFSVNVGRSSVSVVTRSSDFLGRHYYF
jgi:hypothetical protein